MDPQILFEDAAMLVCYKPAGLAVQSRQIRQKDLESMMRTHLREREGTPAYLGVVHRLDQPVEGVVVFARSKETAAALSNQLTDGRMKKTYAAICVPGDDRWTGREGEWVRLEDALVRDPRTNRSHVAFPGEKGARQARLDVRVERTFSLEGTGYALTHVQLLTGRHHQIRVQLAHAQLPIAGDQKYGQNAPALPGDPFPALCARMLTLAHPRTGQEMTFDVSALSRVWTFAKQKGR